MLILASEGFGFSALHGDPNWGGIARWFDHVPWQGGVFWDLIQPAFMFMVGVSMPYSCAARAARGNGWLKLFGHALLRALVLVALGVMMNSNGAKQTDWSFTNVLAQIGLGYA